MLCHTSMSSNDVTAHINGKRHAAALEKAGNAQSVPMAANTEAEANPPIPPGKLPWTCTVCITTMCSNNITSHINGKRHNTALVKARSAQSGPPAATTAAEAIPPSPPDNSIWTCTLCLITMQLKDSKSHQKGKRHIKALAKVGNVQSGPTATPSLQPHFPTPEPSAPLAAVAIGRTKPSTSSKSLAKAQKKKAHTTANPKKTIVQRPVSAYADDWQHDEERSEYFNDPSSCNTHIHNPDYSICDSDCGWCGKCMDGAYVSKSNFILLSLQPIRT